jgi:hypothetical protein
MLPKSRHILNNSLHIQTILKDHIREFHNPGYLDLVDSNLDKNTDWGRAKIHILLCHLLEPERKVSGYLGSVVEDVVISLLKSEVGEKEVFVDVAYMCDIENVTTYKKYNLPIWFGCSTHRSVLDFDVLLITNSTIEEKINIPWLLHHSGIPVWMTERLDNEDIPLIFLGGNSSICCDVLLGESSDGENRSWVDGVFVGFGEEVLNKIPKVLLETKNLKKSDRINKFFQFNNFVHPLAYEHVYKNSWEIDYTNKVIKDAPDYVIMNKRDVLDEYSGADRAILHHGGQTGHVSSNVIISQGCSGGGCCTFCQEGNVSGGWREKSLKKLKDESIKIKLSNSADSVNFLSFNGTYYSKYFELMKESLNVFGKITAQASRVDVTANCPEYFNLNRKFGLMRFTFGLEGFSEKLRNGYLNKNINIDDFYKAIEIACQNRLSEIKLYLIHTGLEVKEDFDEFLGVIDRCIDIRNNIGSKINIRISISNLFCYNFTPMQWECRVPILDNILRVFPELEDGSTIEENKCLYLNKFEYFFNELKKRKVKYRFSFKGGHIVDIAQLINDLGRKMTSIITELTLEKGFFYYCKNRLLKDTFKWVIDELNKKDIKILDVLGKRDYSFVFPENYLYVVEKEYLKKSHEKMCKYEPINSCLSTKVNSIDRKDKVCIGCRYCDKYTDSPLISKNSRIRYKHIDQKEVNKLVESVLESIQKNSIKSKILVKWEKKRNYSHLDPNTVWHYLWSKMMREVSRRYSIDESLKSKSIHHGSVKLNTKLNVTDYSCGIYLNEVHLSEKFLFSLEELKDIFLGVRSEVEVSTYVDAREVDKKYHFPKYSNQVVLFRSIEYDPHIREALLEFSNNVKVLDKRINCNMRVGEKVDIIDNLPKILFEEDKRNSKSIFIASIPGNINPVLFLSSITGDSFGDVVIRYEMRRLLYYNSGMRSCKICGKISLMDLFSLDDFDYCEECYRRAILVKFRNS